MSAYYGEGPYSVKPDNQHWGASFAGNPPADGGFHNKKRLARAPDPAYPCSMTVEDVKALPIDRKIQIMEAIWEDFRDRFDRMEISQEQKALLDRRRARVRNGSAQLLDWESVKGTIGRP